MYAALDIFGNSRDRKMSAEVRSFADFWYTGKPIDLHGGHSDTVMRLTA